MAPRSKFTRVSTLAWQVDRYRLYAKLGALGGMADQANTKIRPEWSWQGKLSLAVGERPEYSPGYTLEVRVDPSIEYLRKWHGNITPKGPPKHRVHVRCPHCHDWQPFGRLHQHILSKRCCEAASIANTLPPIPSLQSAKP